jgi:hypothetical protein
MNARGIPVSLRMFTALVLAASVGACGGTIEPAHATDGGALDGHGKPGDAASPHDDASVGLDAAKGWSPVCPATLPAMGASCSLSDVYCEYGCGNVVVCADGSWGGAVTFGTPACDAGPNPAACPAGLSQIMPGAGCPSVETCSFATGACSCDFPSDPRPDASSTWSCFPETGCPSPRPRVGSACGTSGMRCDYEACGSSQACTGGVWQSTVGACGG